MLTPPTRNTNNHNQLMKREFM
uniref:Uncharacterized protein n=1 Tax=Arundo donax TaxID=35708 RepID=A0A0A9BKJ1_ARUDO